MSSLFGFGFISSRLDGTTFNPNSISNFLRMHLARPGVYTARLTGPGGGGGGKNEVAPHTGQAGTSGGSVTQDVYIHYEGAEFVVGGNGLGGSIGRNFDSGGRGGNGGTTSIRVLNTTVIAAGGGTGGLGGGYGAGAPSYNPVPSGNGGIGGGGWGSNGGQAGGSGFINLTRVA